MGKVRTFLLTRAKAGNGTNRNEPRRKRLADANTPARRSYWCAKINGPGATGEHHYVLLIRNVLLIRTAEVDMDEPPDLQTKPVRAVRRRLDGLRRGTTGDRLKQDDPEVGVQQAHHE